MPSPERRSSQPSVSPARSARRRSIVCRAARARRRSDARVPCRALGARSCARRRADGRHAGAALRDRRPRPGSPTAAPPKWRPRSARSVTSSARSGTARRPRRHRGRSRVRGHSASSVRSRSTAHAVDALATTAGTHRDTTRCAKPRSPPSARSAIRPGSTRSCTRARDRPAVRRRAVLALAPFSGPEVDAAIAARGDDHDWQVRQAAEDLDQS